jgi:hypothetical protein
MTSDDEFVERGMQIFRTIVGRQQQGLCAKRISRFRGAEADYCPSPVRQQGAMYCEPHHIIAEAEAREIEARMLEGDD